MVSKSIQLFVIGILFCLSGFSQEEEYGEGEVQEGRIHKVALVFGYTYIPAAFEEGTTSKSVFVPTIGVDYFMQFAEGWKIGAVIDLELADYLVDFNREELERSRAFVTGILVGYEFASHWSLLLGPGVEFEKHKNLFILRASAEYEFELGKHWGLFPSVNYDFKEEYSSWSVNIGISKRL